MQRTVSCRQGFCSDDRLAVDRGQEANAGVDGLVSQLFAIGCQLSQNHRTGSAVTFGTALFGGAQSRLQAQIVQQGLGGRNIRHLNRSAIEQESDRGRRAGGLGQGHGRCESASAVGGVAPR